MWVIAICRACCAVAFQAFTCCPAPQLRTSWRTPRLMNFDFVSQLKYKSCVWMRSLGSTYHIIITSPRPVFVLVVCLTQGLVSFSDTKFIFVSDNIIKYTYYIIIINERINHCVLVLSYYKRINKMYTFLK